MARRKRRKTTPARFGGRYRIRTGDYRVQFCVKGTTIVVEKIGHRDGFYKG